MENKSNWAVVFFLKKILKYTCRKKILKYLSNYHSKKGKKYPCGLFLSPFENASLETDWNLKAKLGLSYCISCTLQRADSHEHHSYWFHGTHQLPELHYLNKICIVQNLVHLKLLSKMEHTQYFLRSNSIHILSLFGYQHFQCCLVKLFLKQMAKFKGMPALGQRNGLWMSGHGAAHHTSPDFFPFLIYYPLLSQLITINNVFLIEPSMKDVIISPMPERHTEKIKADSNNCWTKLSSGSIFIVEDTIGNGRWSSH